MFLPWYLIVVVVQASKGPHLLITKNINNSPYNTFKFKFGAIAYVVYHPPSFLFSYEHIYLHPSLLLFLLSCFFVLRVLVAVWAILACVGPVGPIEPKGKKKKTLFQQHQYFTNYNSNISTPFHNLLGALLYSKRRMNRMYQFVILENWKLNNFIEAPTWQMFNTVGRAWRPTSALFTSGVKGSFPTYVISFFNLFMYLERAIDWLIHYYL